MQWFIHFVTGKWISLPVIYIEDTKIKIEIGYVYDNKYNNLTFYAYICFLWCSYLWLHMIYCLSTGGEHMFSTLIFLSSINIFPRGPCGITCEPNFHRDRTRLLRGVHPLFAALFRKTYEIHLSCLSWIDVNFTGSWNPICHAPSILWLLKSWRLNRSLIYAFKFTF